ncbi:MAG: hypothetical protein ACRDJO_08190, partial [Actinomycetota bacterium]
MAGRLLPAVLAGIIVIVLGGRAFLRGRRGPGGAGRTAGGALAVLVGSLLVSLAVPPTLDDFFPVEEPTTAAGPTPGPTGPAPTSGAEPGSSPEPAASAPGPEAAPAPSPTAAPSTA